MKEHPPPPPPPPLPPKDTATTPSIEGTTTSGSPFLATPSTMFFNRSSPATMTAGAPMASSIAQRRLQRKPMGLHLDTSSGVASSPSPLASAGFVPPPATATGTWTQRAPAGMLGGDLGQPPPPTPAAIPDAQNIGRRVYQNHQHQHESSSRRLHPPSLPPSLPLPPLSSNGGGGGGRLGAAAAAARGVSGNDEQSSLKAFQEAVNASSLSSSFTLRPTLLGASAAAGSSSSFSSSPSLAPSSPFVKHQQMKTTTAAAARRGEKGIQQRVSGLHYLGASKLAAKLSEKKGGGVVIDMRKSCDYVNSHIVSAIGMTVPTTLVKRANFSVQRLMTMLHASEAQKQQLAHWKQAPWIVIYGEGTYEDTASEDALLVLLARKFMGEAPPGSSCNVYVLEGGYAEFSRLYPAMCEYGDSAGGRQPVVGKLAPLPLPAAISALEEPDMLTVDLDHPMLRKMRQTPGGGCDPNEVISMRMPPEFAALKSSALVVAAAAAATPTPSCSTAAAVAAAAAAATSAPLTPLGGFGSLGEMQLRMLPLYLRLVADPDTGPGLLTRLYKRLDLAELQRLATMINSRGVVTEANQYTISAGIELGSKNRYTTILPFDSNRVRLQQRRSSKPTASTPTPAVSRPAASRPAVNKPLPPLPPGTPLETPVGGISGSAAHLRLRMQGDRPVSYDHGAACTPAVAAKRSSQRVEMRTQGKALLVGADDDDDGDEGGGAAALLGALPAGGGKGQGEAGGADYINASFLRYGGGPLYIAAQGPLASTTGDFWHMVWEQRARVVVMLTRSTEHGRAKCHAYWPDCVGQAAAYGGIRVAWEAEAHHPDDASVVARRLRLTLAAAAGGASAVVTHLQYLGWPDHGVPENPLGVLRLRQLARAAQADAAAPMVVHCSAGCGRTGAFCAIDTLLALGAGDASSGAGDASSVDASVDADGDVRMGGGEGAEGVAAAHNLVFLVVARFREQRMMAVQTGRQFAFCHETLAWALLGVGPRPLERAIDRRLVAEWNRANHPQLSPADCGADVTYLMRGRSEMVGAMQQQQMLMQQQHQQQSSLSLSSSRASVDGAAGSPSVVALPAIRRSNTVGAARRSHPDHRIPVPPGTTTTTAQATPRIPVPGADRVLEAAVVASAAAGDEHALPQLPAVAEEEGGALTAAAAASAASAASASAASASACDAADYFGLADSGTSAAAEWRRSHHQLHLHHLATAVAAAGGANPPGASTPLASPSAYVGSPSPRVK